MDLDAFITRLDLSRSWRVLELSNLRVLFSTTEQVFKNHVARGAVVLTYAHWEGFFSDCVKAYREYLIANGVRVSDLQPSMVVALAQAEFDRLRDRKHSYAARMEFAESLSRLLGHTFENSNFAFASPRSDFSFERYRECCSGLGLDERTLQPHRNFLDFQLVNRRHRIAHGDEVQLDEEDIENLTHRTEECMSIVKREFEELVFRVQAGQRA